MVEYWLEATKRITDGIDYTPTYKLRGTVSLLRDEAYQWWLTVEQGTQPEQITLNYFKNVFQNKYVGASYVKARRSEFMNLVKGKRSVAKYEAKFMRLRRYA